MGNISIRSDPEGQNAYGPSLATVEDTVVEPNGTGGTLTKQVTALGLSKATQEFLTLHYFALDSAAWWERILKELLPDARFPDAVVRRAIAPSHRRYPHPVWVDSFCLIADLLLGCGVGRYLGSLFQQEVAVRGFSAGSYSGLCLLHILWPIPGVVTRGCLGAIACPPSLLKMNLAKDVDRLHLVHYEGDELCCWKAGRQQLEQSCSTFTYIMNESSTYKGHFGPSEHGYSHWLGLDLPHGMMQLSTLLFLRPEAAAKAKRDATPLRLISWLSYNSNPELENFIEKAMLHLSTWEDKEGGRVLQMGKQVVKQGDQIRTETELRDRLIDLVSVGNLRHKPEALFALFRQFMMRISLPRLVHFFDLVLPQLMPVQAAWAGEEKTLWSHNDTVFDLQDAFGLPASDYPPTLYDFLITILYKQNFLADNLRFFPRRDHNDIRDVIPNFHEVLPVEIHHHIQQNAAELVPKLEALATLRAIVEIVHTCPKGFTSYCTISNTVKAIGIGGSASLFVSVKMSAFLASTQEAEARNLVALTRSKGLCLRLLPSTHERTDSSLHALRTLCAYRHGMFHIGKDTVDLDAFATFLTQPDTVDFGLDGQTVDSTAPFSLDS